MLHLRTLGHNAALSRDRHERNPPNGPVTLPNAVPAGATAVQINLTAADQTGPNFLAVTSGSVESTETSVFNWGAGEIQIANSITVPVNATARSAPPGATDPGEG